MRESSKAQSLRAANGDFATYLRGDGIDIGAGRDLLVVPEGSVRGWDRQDGDAQELAGIADQSYDFVYSSHCLEHMRNVEIALRNWARVCRAGGYLYVVVPEWTVYEQRTWPSRHNRDHRSSFGLITAPRPDHSHYVIADLVKIGAKLGLYLVDVRLDLDRFEFALHRNAPPAVDQTRRGAQAQLTVIWRKSPQVDDL